MVNLTDGPIIALVMEMSNEWINMLQAACDNFDAEGDHASANAASVRLERMCMLRSLAQMSITQPNEAATQKDQTPDIQTQITSYLQEHDPEVFPITFKPDGEILLLDTQVGVSYETFNWLDAIGAPIILVKASRNHPYGRGANAAELGLSSTPSPKPAFIPERLPQPIRPAGMPEAPAHKPEINRGMPMSGEMQGMPGGRLGDR